MIHPQIKQLEYNYITDGIYIGTNQCCQTHFDQTLKKEGIEADISLEGERIDVPFGVKFMFGFQSKIIQLPHKSNFNVEFLF